MQILPHLQIETSEEWIKTTAYNHLRWEGEKKKERDFKKQKLLWNAVFKI